MSIRPRPFLTGRHAAAFGTAFPTRCSTMALAIFAPADSTRSSIPFAAPMMPPRARAVGADRRSPESAGPASADDDEDGGENQSQQIRDDAGIIQGPDPSRLFGGQLLVLADVLEEKNAEQEIVDTQSPVHDVRPGPGTRPADAPRSQSVP